MKQVEIITEKEETIDWSMKQYVTSGYKIVLTTGEQTSDNFSGFCLPCKATPYGEFSEYWSKHLFTLFTGKATLEISND